MKMTPEQLLSFERERCQNSLSGFERTEAARGMDAAFLNLQWASQHALGAAMVQWRHHLGSPSQSMVKVVEIGQLAARNFRALKDTKPAWKAFNFTVVQYASFLTCGQADSSLKECDCEFDDWRVKEVALPVGRFLDAGVIYALSNGEIPDSWSAFMSSFASKQRDHLMRTYATYMQIITAANRKQHAEMLVAVSSAAENFWKRAKDRSYKDTVAIEAGGLDNDYQLTIYF